MPIPSPAPSPSPTGVSYYISPTGDDATGTGAMDRPWKSLAKATATVSQPGATIRILPGSYLETSQSRLAVGVSIEGSGPNSVIRSTLSQNFTPIIQAASPEGTNGNQSIRRFTLDGNNLTTVWGIHISGRSNVSIHDMTITNFHNTGVIFGGKPGGEPGAPGIYARGNRFYNNVLTNSANYDGQTGSGALSIGGQIGMEIYGNTITQLGRGVGKNGWPIKAWSEGYLHGVKIYDNILLKQPYDGAFYGQTGWDFAIELFNVSGLEIYGNKIQGSIDLNFQRKGNYPYSVWIHDNTIEQTVLNSNPESAIILEFETESAIIERNTIRNVMTGILFSTRAGSFITDVRVQNNTFMNIGLAGSGNGNSGGAISVVSDGTNSYTINNLSVVNNTMIASATDSPYWGIMLSNTSGRVAGINLINNILENFDAGWFGSTTSAPIVGFTARYNNFRGNGGGNAPSFTGGTPIGYVNADNRSVDCQIVSDTNPTLRSSSPCIDAGIATGLPFKGAAPDLGGREF